MKDNKIVKKQNAILHPTVVKHNKLERWNKDNNLEFGSFEVSPL